MGTADGEQPGEAGLLAFHTLDRAIAGFEDSPTAESAVGISALFDQMILRLLSVTARYGEIDSELIDRLHRSLGRFSSIVDRLKAPEGAHKIAIQSETLDAVAAGEIDRAFTLLGEAA